MNVEKAKNSFLEAKQDLSPRTLEHDGAMAVFLLHEGELIGRFYQIGVTPESLQAECARHLVKCHRWNGCLWSRKEETHDSL